MNEPESKKQSRSQMLIALVVICIIGFAYHAFFAELESFDFAYNVGSGIGRGLVFSLILSLFVIKKKSVLIHLISFICVTASIVLGTLWMHHSERDKVLSSLESFEEAASAYLDGQPPNDAEVSSEEINSPRSRGRRSEDFSALMRFNESILQRFGAVASEYQAEIKALGLLSVLDFESLKAKGDFESRLSAIEAARGSVTRVQNRSAELYEEILSEARELPIPSKGRQDFVRGLEQSMNQTSETKSRIWDLEREMLDAFESIIRILRKYDWHLDKEGYVILPDEVPTSGLNAAFDTLGRATEEQEKLQARLRNSFEQGLEELSQDIN